MPKYTTITEIENYTLTEIALSFKSQVESWIDAVESFIDKFCQRNFKADTIATIKLYDGLPPTDTFKTKTRKEYFIDDCVEVVELKIDGKIVPATDYLLYPANSLPKTRILLKKESGYVFSSGEQNISVKAKWGYSVDPPKDIVFAATVLTAGVINYSRGKSLVRTEAIGNYSVAYEDELHWQDYERVMNILRAYQKISI